MQIGLGIGTTFRQKWVPSLTEQIRSLLFGSGQQGAWYDPSDMSTLFQDSAGTTPVTAVEQPVGRMLDKSGRGNHATQATTTKRPVLSRRVNLLTKTEEFVDAVWFKGGAAVGAPAPTDGGSITAPDGTSTARLYTFSAAAFVRQELAFPSGLQGSAKVYVRAGLVSPAKAVRITTNNTLNWSTGFSTKVALTREWQLVTHSGVLQTGSARVFLMFGAADAAGANDPDCVGSIELWHPSLVPADQASLPYQRVNTATDYDADPAKFPAYLRFDGVNDALQTGNIDFTSTDKMTVWAGVTKLSDPIEAELYGLSVNPLTLSGSFMFRTSGGNGDAKATSGYAKGTASFQQAFITAPAPVNIVHSLAINLGASSITNRVNGLASTTSAALGGVFGNYPLYIGARAGTSLYFNGRLYSLIVRGAQSSLSQIEATELHIKQKMRLP